MRRVFPTTAPDVAEIVVVPTPIEVARPVELIVATGVFRERHVTEFVRFRVVPLE